MSVWIYSPVVSFATMPRGITKCWPSIFGFQDVDFLHLAEQGRQLRLSCVKCLCVGLWKDCSPSLFAAIWGRAASSKWLFGVLICSSLLEPESRWQTCALLLEWWVEHQKSYRNMREEARWLICLTQGDISSVPNLFCLHLSWEQLVAAVSSSWGRGRAAPPGLPSGAVIAVTSWLVLAGRHPALASPPGSGLVAHRESPKSWGLFSNIKDHSGYLFCYVGKMRVYSFFIWELFQSS